MNRFYLLFFYFSFAPISLTDLVEKSASSKIERVLKERSDNVDEIVNEQDNVSSLKDATIFKSTKKYYCFIENIGHDTETLVYGTKAWTFPVQDVSLTLTYPTANDQEEGNPFPGYVITGFQVILNMDGYQSTGYIDTGGMLEESISLRFVCNNITNLAYQFWLYGTEKSLFQTFDPHEKNLYSLC